MLVLGLTNLLVAAIVVVTPITAATLITMAHPFAKHSIYLLDSILYYLLLLLPALL
jgi:hypothetical protein